MSTEKIEIQSRCPVRVDLAGGTVDIWPLYLFLPTPKTINFGINLFAQTTILAEPSETPTVTLTSKDLHQSIELSWDEILDESRKHVPELDLLARLVRYFAQIHPHPRSQRFELSTSAKSPAGAGLGGSSALSISMIGALWKWVNPGKTLDLDTEAEFLISLTRDVESQVLHAPAGLQDYYGAAFGGLQVLEWKIAKNERTALPASTLKELEKRTLLFYSGKSRNSGINNWQLFKGLIDREPEVDQKFRGICEATLAVEASLLKQDFHGVVAAVQAEWEIRKTLARGISTETMNEAKKRASGISKIAFKVCGAGGGGCFFVLLPDADPKLKNAVQKSVLELPDIQALPFEVVPHGLRIT